MSLVCNIVTRGTLPGVMVGVLTSDVSISPLYNCPMMVTWATTLNWYAPLGLRLLMSPPCGGRREGVTGVPTRLPL